MFPGSSLLSTAILRLLDRPSLPYKGGATVLNMGGTIFHSVYKITFLDRTCDCGWGGFCKMSFINRTCYRGWWGCDAKFCSDDTKNSGYKIQLILHKIGGICLPHVQWHRRPGEAPVPKRRAISWKDISGFVISSISARRVKTTELIESGLRFATTAKVRRSGSGRSSFHRRVIRLSASHALYPSTSMAAVTAEFSMWTNSHRTESRCPLTNQRFG